jgi:hypothetical protein
MLFLAAGPVLVSIFFASVLIWETPPYGFNCRSIMFLSIGASWLISAWLSYAAWRHGKFSRKQHWRLSFWKDVVVAIPSVLLIFLSSVGLFNTCYCWSIEVSEGEGASVPLNAGVEFARLDRKLYPILVSLCMFSQLALYVAIRIVSRRGLKQMAWSEGERQKEFSQN